MIAPIKASTIELRAPRGHTIETLNYYGTYPDGRHRYYATRWGFETLKLLGSDGLAEVWVNHRKVGTVNPAFRDGQFR